MGSLQTMPAGSVSAALGVGVGAGVGVATGLETAVGADWFPPHATSDSVKAVPATENARF